MRMLSLAALSVLAAAPMMSAQERAADTTAQALFVFVDCNAPNCDLDHLRREITWVNWVRDREDSDVHLMVTFQRTGGGGWHYTLDYIGRREFDGVGKTLAYVSDPDDTDAEVRDELTQTIALGLVQFAETTPVASRLRVQYLEPEVAVVEREESDPWNLWVFRLSANGSVSGESQESGYSFRGSARADRVSEDFKISFDVSGYYSRDEFELDDTETYVNTTEDYSADMLLVWSLGGHWSLGGTASANRSTYDNRDLALIGGPAVEFDIFPYDESTRRSVTLRYAVEAASFDYELETVEGKTDEFLGRHRLVVGASVQQPWGRINGSVEGIQYFQDLETHRINTFLNLEYRLFRGLSFNTFGTFSRIKDQFYIPAEDLTEEEILLRRRQRETDYRYRIGIGLSYRFGSKFANIVNPRMGGGGGFFFFF